MRSRCVLAAVALAVVSLALVACEDIASQRPFNLRRVRGNRWLVQPTSDHLSADAAFASVPVAHSSDAQQQQQQAPAIETQTSVDAGPQPELPPESTSSQYSDAPEGPVSAVDDLPPDDESVDEQTHETSDDVEGALEDAKSDDISKDPTPGSSSSGRAVNETPSGTVDTSLVRQEAGSNADNVTITTTTTTTPAPAQPQALSSLAPEVSSAAASADAEDDDVAIEGQADAESGEEELDARSTVKPVIVDSPPAPASDNSEPASVSTATPEAATTTTTTTPLPTTTMLPETTTTTTTTTPAPTTTTPAPTTTTTTTTAAPVSSTTTTTTTTPAPTTAAPAPVSTTTSTTTTPAPVSDTNQARSSNATLLAPPYSAAAAATNSSQAESQPGLQFDDAAYTIDQTSCNALNATGVPVEIIKLSVERIMRLLTSSNCSAAADLRLRPGTNKRLRGFVMQAGAMRLSLNELMSPVHTVVHCLPAANSSSTAAAAADDGSVNFKLAFANTHGELSARVPWRMYERVELKSPMTGATSPRGRQPMERARCTRYGLRAGDFELQLIGLRSRVEFELHLRKLDARKYAASASEGGRVMLREFAVRQLYLDHELHVHASSPNAFKATQDKRKRAQPLLAMVTIMHDKNSAHRRNNWLLDMYANWLREQCRAQLGRLFRARSFAAAFDKCLASD